MPEVEQCLCPNGQGRGTEFPIADGRSIPDYRDTIFHCFRCILRTVGVAGGVLLKLRKLRSNAHFRTGGL